MKLFNLHEAKTRLAELLKAVARHNVVVVLCRGGRELAEIRRRQPRRRRRTPAADPRFAVEFTEGYGPDEPLSDREWPAGLE